MNQPTLSGFDWNTLDPDTRAIVQDTTRRLHELERRTSEAVIQIGRGLIDTKDRLRKAGASFDQWRESEFGWSERTAQNFMRVAEVFGNTPAIIAGSTPTALYALASGTVPDHVRESFIERAEAGQPVRHRDVKQAIEADRRTATVDLDSGEVLDDDPEIEAEVVDPSDPVSFLPPVPNHRATPAPMPVSADIRDEEIGKNDPDVERVRMRRLYKTAISHATNNMIPLKPAAVVASFGPGDADDARRFVARMRSWCDEIESEMGRSIRLIHRKEA